MKYIIEQRDKDLILQDSLDYKYKLLVLNHNGHILDELFCVLSVGSYSIDSESDIRRTTSLSLLLEDTFQSMSIEEKIYDWIGLDFQLQIGIYNINEDDYVWYNCGNYLITEGNTSYDTENNTINISLSDYFSKLNGTRNGQIGGAPTISIPNVDEKGNMITIKQVTENLLKSETDIKRYIIDDIGQFNCMPQNNPDYEQYRKNNPNWNQLPYNLEYEAGCSIGDIFSEIKNLYPNCQMYFDIDNVFHFNMIPSCEHEPVALDNDFLQQIIVSSDSENTTYNIEDIKNVTEVFGADYEIDRYADTCTSSTNIYTISLSDYNNYSSGDRIAFIPDSANIANMKIRINSLSAIPIYYEYTSNYIEKNLLAPAATYVLQIKKVNDSYVAYYLGKYQPHALCVLTDNANDGKYTKSYFAKKYNCDIKNISFRVEENSPFTIQRIGEVLDVKTGDEFENINSDLVALENAIYFNKKSTTINDVVTITTKMMPFLDVNLKVSYKKQQDNDAKYYVIKSIEHDTESLLSKITMYRFYPLYYA